MEYEDGLALMRIASDAVRAGVPPLTDHVFLLEHPPVVTLGRRAPRENIIASSEWLNAQGFEVHETDRGGDVTYHGPGQIVGYPVLDLSDLPDVRRYVASLEDAMVGVCIDFGVEAIRDPEHRGAWVDSRKIGAVGVHLSRWITSHGFAFNLDPDLRHFGAIVPCGIKDPRLGVTSLAAELRSRGLAVPVREAVEARLAHHLAESLERESVSSSEPRLRTVSVVAVGSDGRVLLLRRVESRGGFWQPITGRVEHGETAEAAARREAFEEIGARVPVEPLSYRHALPLERGPGELVIAEEEAFTARLVAGFVPKLSAEHSEYAWLSPEEAMSRVPFAGLRRAVKLAAMAFR